MENHKHNNHTTRVSKGSMEDLYFPSRSKIGLRMPDLHHLETKTTLYIALVGYKYVSFGLHLIFAAYSTKNRKHAFV